MGIGPGKNPEVLAALEELRRLKATRGPESGEFNGNRMVADGVTARLVEGVSERVVGEVDRVVPPKKSDRAA